jgi:hypothetical protein
MGTGEGQSHLEKLVEIRTGTATMRNGYHRRPPCRICFTHVETELLYVAD